MSTFLPYMRKNEGGGALELGCLSGFMSALIATHVKHLTVVDGSKTFIDMARKVVPSNVEFVHSLFEDYAPENQFDFVFATYVLEHVENPTGFLESASRFLHREGLLFLVVPNARSLSRQLARHMGLIDDLYALTDNDINHGHRRVYDRVKLNRDIELAGLQQVAQGGLMLKPFADFQMDRLIEEGILGELHLEGLYKMGLEYPDLAGGLFSICRNSQ
jgi:2-polyprenyl-3-methyl-5-hydroxy-6-metoxy-1,4-benzoquinol methylase